MKKSHMRAAVAVFVASSHAPTLRAAEIDCLGDVNGGFQNGANWERDAMPNSATYIHRFKSPAGPTTITNASVVLADTGTTPGANQARTSWCPTR